MKPNKFVIRSFYLAGYTIDGIIAEYPHLSIEQALTALKGIKPEVLRDEVGNANGARNDGSNE